MSDKLRRAFSDESAMGGDDLEPTVIVQSGGTVELQRGKSYWITNSSPDSVLHIYPASRGEIEPPSRPAKQPKKHDWYKFNNKKRW